MKNKSLIQECTFMCAREIMKIIGISTMEEYTRLWPPVYDACRAMFESYEIKADRRELRLNPSKN